MNNKGAKLSRRKFIFAGSIAVASPMFLRPAGLMTATASDEIKTAEARSVVKETKIYTIEDGCVGCQTCRTFCPADAIRYGDCKNEIIQEKCIHCGICFEECQICVISVN